MKVLYAIQGTGNGHLARAIELAPYLKKELDLDFLISGRSAELEFPYEFKFNYHGIYFIFGKRGGIDHWNTLKQQKPFSFIKDVLTCPVKNYDAVINDFEPVSAWASVLKGVKCIAVSHQSAFGSKLVPRPVSRSRFFEFAMKYFAPYRLSSGSHYRSYDESISLPLIRKELQGLQDVSGDHILIYLPSYSDEFLLEHFIEFPDESWKIFSKRAKSYYKKENVEVYPVDRNNYSKALIHSKAVILGAGFQASSEALYLKKKMLVVPMYDQYEQLCNAAALKELGVYVLDRIDENFAEVLSNWLNMDNACSYSFEADTQKLASRILKLL